MSQIFNQLKQSNRLSDIALMRLAVAIKASIRGGFVKRVAFKLMKQMKNGALWVMYTVDNIKCSTFVKASSFAHLVSLASIELTQVKHEYVERLKAMYPGVGVSFELEYFTIAVNTGKVYKTYYLFEGSDYNWELRIKKDSPVRAKYRNLQDAIKTLQTEPI